MPWGIGSVFFAAIKEETGATGGGRNALAELSVGIRLIRDVPGFKRFIIARIFLLIGFAQAGLWLGRKTYLVDGAPEDDRPLCVAVSNTLIGMATLCSGVLWV